MDGKTTTIGEHLDSFSDRNIWLVGAGDRKRDFASLLIDKDVIAAGPGEPGPYEREPYEHKDDSFPAIGWFHDRIRRGDIAVLRVGVKSIRAVGVVEEDYSYNTAFSDVDGWNIAHIRRCRWLWKEGLEWKDRGMGAQGATLRQSRNEGIRRWVAQLAVREGEFSRRLPDLPHEAGRPLSLENLGDYLFERGLSLEYTEDLVINLQRIHRLTGWFGGIGVSEHETTAYVVVPVLLSLGWTQQTMGIEWRGADVALFSRLPRKAENVVTVVEVKKIGYSLRKAVGQAKGYVKGKNFSGCHQVVATDGRRWEIHRRRNGSWAPFAYFDVKDPREDYPLLHVSGAAEGLQALIP